MNKSDLAKFFKGVQQSLSKHSPEILVGLGITGMVTTVVLAVRATPKALENIEKKKKDEKKDKLTVGETVKATWKCYIPTAITGVTSAACVIGANSVNTRRNAALAAAYKLTETAFTEYREKVVETIGEKKEQVVHDKIAEDRVAKNPVSSTDVIITEKGNTRFMDGISGRRFLSDMDKIKRAVNEINYRITTDFCGYVTLTEFYDEIGLPGTDISDELVWRCDRGLLELRTSAQIDEDGVPCIVLSYAIPPMRT